MSTSIKLTAARSITALIDWTAQPVSVAFYLMGAALISLAAVFTLTDHTGEVLS
jgi:MHS family proline/betaine transporter-like MFS transporter